MTSLNQIPLLILHMSYHHHNPRTAAKTPTVRLPKNLSRPEFIDVSPAAILTAAPNLVDVPLVYIKQMLLNLLPSMSDGISSLALASHVPATIRRSQIRTSISVPLLPSSSSMQAAPPTHILALSSSNPTENSRDPTVWLFPAHALVLASHLAFLPLPAPTTAECSLNFIILPVVSLSIPSPATFGLLNVYMYTHRLDNFLNSLIPIPKNTPLSYNDVIAALDSRSTLHHLSSYLCSASNGSLQALTAHAASIREVWQNCVALGLHEPELWDALDLSWEIVLGALNISAAKMS